MAIKYYKYKDFVQPILSSNGTLGGDSFAVHALEYKTYYTWKAFDGDASGGNSSANSHAWIFSSSYDANNEDATALTIYNPVAIKITKLELVNQYTSNISWGIKAGDIYGYNEENTSWVKLTSFSDLDCFQYSNIININNDNFYKYYKLVIKEAGTSTSTYGVGAVEIFITAKEQTAIESTADDYDYTEDDTPSGENTSGGSNSGTSGGCNCSQDINVGAISEALNNKADLDLNNTNPLARTVVEVSEKSLMPSWYRVYSDGWCEQGGISKQPAGSTTTYFIRTFVDTNYNLVQDSEGYDARNKNGSPLIYNKAINSFTSYYGDAYYNTNGINWRASGYINITTDSSGGHVVEGGSGEEN